MNKYETLTNGERRKKRREEEADAGGGGEGGEGGGGRDQVNVSGILMFFKVEPRLEKLIFFKILISMGWECCRRVFSTGILGDSPGFLRIFH